VRSGSRFLVGLLTIAVLAFGLRIVVLAIVRDEPVGGDGFAYVVTSALLADGEGYVHPIQTDQPGAHHPPGWTTVLALPALLGVDSYAGLQRFAAVVGTAAVVLVGLLGRKVAGERVGLIAAVLAAVYPGFWKYERELLSETLLFAVLALVLLLAYRYLDGPSGGRAVALGVALGVAIHTRPELLLLLVFLVVPLTLRRAAEPKERVLHLGLAGVATVAVIAPWTAYNLGRFDEPVVLTTGLGAALSVANCEVVYEGELLGSYEPLCAVTRVVHAPDKDRSEEDRELRRAGLDYMADHAGRLPAVEAARFGRTWSLYRPGQQITLDHEWSHTPVRILWAQLLAFWVLALVSVLGAVALRRRRTPRWPLLAPVFVVLTMGLFITGQPRYRSPAEVPLVILAAVGVDALVRRAGRSRGARSAEAVVPDALSRR
jgi:4-amino-4-deoxy-L-arabinose transferase-like glycosyltransferase